MKKLFNALLFLHIIFIHSAIISLESPTATQKEVRNNPIEKVENIPASLTSDASWLGWISKTVEQTHSLPIRILLVFLLGLLMSLTPCIYPMIPITAGILQTQASRSVIMSFLLALSYTCGIATTFAILGLLAAFAGQAMGQLMNQPLFIIPLVGLLVYLALAMIGLYDMYIPRFMQPRDHTVNGGSFVSAFVFGAISGIVASPCLSPGLVCLLCIVTTLNSTVLGFILLFAFGIGLSVPLLIIGTFSNSLSVLPRAGMWMVEVKKLFGFLMLAMCLYFLNYIIPSYYMTWLIIAFTFTIGSLFLYMSLYAHSRIWRLLYRGLGIVLITSAVFFAVKAAQQKHTLVQTHTWKTNYKDAQAQAHLENKKLFVDIGAPFCSICTAIDNTLFADKTVMEFLETTTVPVKINGSDTTNKELLQKFHVLGFPTILLLDAHTQEVLKQWGPELYGMPTEQFITQVKEKL